MEPVSSIFSDRLILLIIALLVNAALAGPPGLRRALGLDRLGRLPARLLHMLERKLNRERRSAEERERRGTLLVVTVVAVGVAVGFVCVGFSYSTYFGLIDVVLLACILQLRQVADFTRRSARLNAVGEGERARAELMEGHWRNAALLDGYGMNRAAIETLAVTWCERVISPAFWYIIFGLPGLLACTSVTVLATTTAQVHEAFGRSAQIAARWVHGAPSLLATFLLVGASMFLPFCQPGNAATLWGNLLPSGNHRQRALAVTGGALNLALGGPTSVYAQGPWIGGAVAQVLPRDAERAVMLLWTSALFVLIIAGMLALTA